MKGDLHTEAPKLEIREEGIRKLLLALKVNKASGPDNIPNRLLKNMVDELSPILQNIYTQSLSTGELPQDWLNANIAPIYKKGDRHCPANYRPVSLISVCCKILEHIVCHHLHKHLTWTKIRS